MSINVFNDSLEYQTPKELNGRYFDSQHSVSMFCPQDKGCPANCKCYYKKSENRSLENNNESNESMINSKFENLSVKSVELIDLSHNEFETINTKLLENITKLELK